MSASTRSPSALAFDGSGKLLEVIVVVSGEAGHPVTESQPAEPEVDAASLPLRLCERCQETDRFRAMASEGRERVAWIVARVLPFLGPPIGIERCPTGPPMPHAARAAGSALNVRIVGSSSARMV